MPGNVQQTHIPVKATCAWSGMEEMAKLVHDMHMRAVTKRKVKEKQAKPPQFQVSRMRAWREHRGKTLEEMAAKCGMTYNQLSKMERGYQPYKQAILETYAKELNCTVIDLLSRAPGEAEDILSLWSKADERGRKSAVLLLKSSVE